MCLHLTWTAAGVFFTFDFAVMPFLPNYVNFNKIIEMIYSTFLANQIILFSDKSFGYS